MPTIRQVIVPDGNIKNVINELRSLPGRIQIAQDTLEEAEHEAFMFDGDAEALAMKERLEGEAYFEARETVDPETNKKKYTNEEQRKAAVRMICNKDPEYIEVINTIVKAKGQKAKLKMNVGKAINTVKFLTNQYYGMKAIAGIIEGLARESLAADDLKRYARIRATIAETPENKEEITHVKQE